MQTLNSPKSILSSLWNNGYLFLFLLACFYITFFSFAGTPIRVDYHLDSSFFMLMGKLLLEGKIPYVDFFDHKGPSLILLEAIGQFIAPYRTGIFILEIVNLFVTLVLIFKTAKLVLNNIQSYAVCLSFLIFIKYYFVGGHSSEELSFVPSFLSLYYFSRVFFKGERITAKNAFIIGLCFSFLFWLKATHALIITAICFSLFVFSLLDKDYKSLKTLILYFILGQLPFSLLYLGFFAYHGAVYDLINGTFLHNVAYIQEKNTTLIRYSRSNISLFLCLLIGSSLYYIRSKRAKIFVFAVALLITGLISANIGQAIGHYSLTMAPAIVFSMILIIYSIKNKYISYFMCIVIFLFCLRLFIYQVGTIFYMKEHVERRVSKSELEYKNLLSVVPEEEYDKIFFYNVFVDVYPLMDISPNYKYFALQEWMGMSNPQIFEEINQSVLEDPPIWVMIQFYNLKEGGVKDFDEYINQDFIRIVKENYSIVNEVGPYLLFKLN